VVDAVEANAGWWGQVVGDGHELWVPEVKVGGGCEWWAVEASGGWQRRVVGGGVEWWAVESSGGHWRQVVGAEAKWWMLKPNGGWWRQMVGGSRYVVDAEAE